MSDNRALRHVTRNGKCKRYFTKKKVLRWFLTEYGAHKDLTVKETGQNGVTRGTHLNGPNCNCFRGKCNYVVYSTTQAKIDIYLVLKRVSTEALKTTYLLLKCVFGDTQNGYEAPTCPLQILPNFIVGLRRVYVLRFKAFFMSICATIAKGNRLKVASYPSKMTNFHSNWHQNAGGAWPKSDTRVLILHFPITVTNSLAQKQLFLMSSHVETSHEDLEKCNF